MNPIKTIKRSMENPSTLNFAEQRRKYISQINISSMTFDCSACGMEGSSQSLTSLERDVYVFQQKSYETCICIIYWDNNEELETADDNAFLARERMRVEDFQMHKKIDIIYLPDVCLQFIIQYFTSRKCFQWNEL